MGAQVFADKLRFVLFKRAGVRLLLGNTDDRESVKNRLALDFQFPRQIIDSNLAHPLSLFLLSPKAEFLRSSNARSGSSSGIANRSPSAVLIFRGLFDRCFGGVLNGWVFASFGY